MTFSPPKVISSESWVPGRQDEPYKEQKYLKERITSHSRLDAMVHIKPNQVHIKPNQKTHTCFARVCRGSSISHYQLLCIDILKMNNTRISVENFKYKNNLYMINKFGKKKKGEENDSTSISKFLTTNCLDLTAFLAWIDACAMRAAQCIVYKHGGDGDLPIPACTSYI